MSINKYKKSNTAPIKDINESPLSVNDEPLISESDESESGDNKKLRPSFIERTESIGNKLKEKYACC